MILSASVRGNAPQLARYLLAAGENERVALLEMRGFADASLAEAFGELEDVASGTRCDRHLYHLTVNTRREERLTPEQRARALDRIEAELGFAGQPRAVVLHEKKGREHLHVVWSRIDVERMTAISDSFNYRRHELVARELEREFGHERVQGAHAERERVERPRRNPSRDEKEQAKRTGIGRDDARALITPLWHQADSGKSFAAALDEKGWILAPGDRRDFVVVDPASEPHSLSRCVEGVRAKEVRARMAEIDPATLPTLEAARAIQDARQRALTTTTADLVQESVPMPSDPAMPVPDEQEARQQAEREAELLAQAQAQKEALAAQAKVYEAYEEATRREAETARAEAEERQKADTGRAANGDLADAGSRYAEALSLHYDIRRPYASLAAAAMDEHGRFAREQAELKEQAAAANDPAERRLLELRQQIEAADYMALTSDRLARIGRVVAGDFQTPEQFAQHAQRVIVLYPDNPQTAPAKPQHVKDAEAARAWQEKATALRAERAALLKAREIERADEAAAARKRDDTDRQDKVRQEHNATAQRTGRAADPSKPKDAAAERQAAVERRKEEMRQQRQAALQRQQQELTQERGTRGR